MIESMVTIETILMMFFIQVMTVFFADISGAADTLKSLVKYIFTKGKMKDSNYILKPFDCSLCLCFWGNIIYLLCTSNFTLPYLAIVCILCTFTGLLKDCILLIEDIARKVINIIYKYFIDK